MRKVHWFYKPGQSFTTHNSSKSLNWPKHFQQSSLINWNGWNQKTEDTGTGWMNFEKCFRSLAFGVISSDDFQHWQNRQHKCWYYNFSHHSMMSEKGWLVAGHKRKGIDEWLFIYLYIYMYRYTSTQCLWELCVNPKGYNPKGYNMIQSSVANSQIS